MKKSVNLSLKQTKFTSKLYKLYILTILTIVAHNRIHKHNIWNKGIKKSTSQVWKRIHEKAQAHRLKTFMPKFKEAFELQLSGMKLKDIALQQGISRRQVSDRIKRYKDLIN